MGDISKNFSRNEFKCSCCNFATVDVELIKVLEIVRAHFEAPIKITSGSRCNEHNAEVGGSQGSKHKLGIAADIVVDGVNPYAVYRFLDNHMPDKYGIGLYVEKGFTHIDIRKSKARWKG
jgi:uncharacterized protein YcbK (DUF882 family)